MSSHRNDLFWISLNMIPGLGFVRIKNLTERFGPPGKIFEAPQDELMKTPGIGKEFASRIACFNPEKEAAGEISSAREKKVQIITIENRAYPARLKEIFDPPVVLYVRGSLLQPEENSVAVVGTRHPSFYGKMVAEDFGRKFAARGITVVSGMARGIDTAAHKGAVSAGGRTIAVLGCGVDVCYPPENSKMMESIAAKGAVISEYPLGTAPDRGNFPRRNRIISGMSLGVVVVEAAQKSGSLITASLALEQGRDVFAVPGKVDSPRSIGTNGLIKEGAKLVNGIDDVLEDLMINLVAPGPGNGHPPAAKSALLPEEERVLGILSSDPLHVDVICAGINLPASRVSSLLMMLEMKGLVKQLPGKQFAKNKRE